MLISGNEVSAFFVLSLSERASGDKMKRLQIIQSILLVLIVLVCSTGAWAKTVTLSWDPSPSDITGYRIYYNTDSSTPPFTGTGATEGGSPIDVGNVLTFTINGLNDADDHYFAVTAYDDAGNESTYSNTVHSPEVVVVQPNQAPVLEPVGDQAVAEGDTLSFDLSASDADGDNLSFSASGLPSGASFSGGSFNWSPGMSQAGSYTVSFSVSDGDLSDSETVSITVSNVNQAPVIALDDSQIVAEGAQLVFSVDGSDPDGDSLSFSAAGLPEGASFDSATRRFSWTPGYEETENTRIYLVTFSVSDGQANDSAGVTLNVTNTNRTPIIESIADQSLDVGVPFEMAVQASDPDNNDLTYSVGNLPAGASFSAATGVLNWTPATDQDGDYVLTFSVSDADLSDSASATLHVAAGNTAPVLATIGAQSVAENSTLSFALTATDADGDSLDYSASGLPEGATFSAQTFHWTPDFDQAGSVQVTFSVTDGTAGDSESVTITVSNTNRPPTLSGSPQNSVMATTGYSFTPQAGDPDADTLSFTIVNRPAWASFDNRTGTLSGTPDTSDVGTTSGIQISASDGQESTALTPFSIDVVAYSDVDSDGDGVPDGQDAFPEDGEEWLDSDGDEIGNNADTDDDNDGVADQSDGFPLDATLSGWVISAQAGPGGSISPAGDTMVEYGASQTYQMTPSSGYYIADVRVDNQSIGVVSSYRFADITEHCSIDVTFAVIPQGLSLDPAERGLPGIARVDQGDDRTNLDNGVPRQDLDFRFQVILREQVTADQRNVYLVLNGYRYAMQLAEGALSSGAEYRLTTRLGPAATHSFYYLLEDDQGTVLERYPESSSLQGPLVELLNGRNLVGVSGAVDGYALDAEAALGEKQVFRWIPDSGPKGSFKLIDAGGAVTSGEGYVIKKASNSTLPDLNGYGDITQAVYSIPVKTGWNLISNPYGGHVALSDLQVQVGNASPMDWLDAVSANLVVDLIYSYLGEDWDEASEFASAAGSSPAVLTPNIGYWVYINPAAETVSLLVPKPVQ